MFLHSSSRNHRSKGSNVKKILQLMVVLAVACWLIYQVKHSHEKKNEFVRNHESKPSKGGEEIYLGRKGDAGSENVVIIDPSGQGSDESSEMKQDAVQHDSTDLKGVENSKDELLLKDSQGSNLNNGEKESTQREHADSYANDGEETLRLPTERERANSSDKDKNSSDGGRDIEEREHLDDGENGDSKRGLDVGETLTDKETVSSSTDKIESSENGGKQDQHENKIEASNQDVSATDETLKEEGADTDDENRATAFETSDIKIDSASKNEVADDVLRHTKDSNDFNNGEVSHEAVEENAFQNDNEASEEGKVETQIDDSVNATLEKTKIDGKSEKEIENSSSEEKDASSVVPVDSQSEKSSGTEGTENVKDDQETSSEADDHSKDVKVEMDSQRGDSGETGNSESNSLEEIEKSSEVIEQSGSNDLEKEIAAGDADGSPEHHDENFKRNSDDVTADSPKGNEISGAGNEDHAANEEGKNEKINSVYLTDEISESKPEAEVKTEEDAANASAEGEASEEKAVQ